MLKCVYLAEIVLIGWIVSPLLGTLVVFILPTIEVSADIRSLYNKMSTTNKIKTVSSPLSYQQ